MLITSRNPAFTALAQMLALGVLPSKDAVEFLAARTKDDDQGSAEALAELLGFLPLALEQAGAYVESRSDTPAGYLELASGRLERLLEEPRASDYPLTVRTTWELAFEAVREQSPAGLELLTLAAFLAADDIPAARSPVPRKTSPSPTCAIISPRESS